MSSWPACRFRVLLDVMYRLSRRLWTNHINHARSRKLRNRILDRVRHATGIILVDPRDLTHEDRWRMNIQTCMMLKEAQGALELLDDDARRPRTRRPLEASAEHTVFVLCLRCPGNPEQNALVDAVRAEWYPDPIKPLSPLWFTPEVRGDKPWSGMDSAMREYDEKIRECKTRYAGDTRVMWGPFPRHPQLGLGPIFVDPPRDEAAFARPQDLFAFSSRSHVHDVRFVERRLSDWKTMSLWDPMATSAAGPYEHHIPEIITTPEEDTNYYSDLLNRKDEKGEPVFRIYAAGAAASVSASHSVNPIRRKRLDAIAAFIPRFVKELAILIASYDHFQDAKLNLRDGSFEDTYVDMDYQTRLLTIEMGPRMTFIDNTRRVRSDGIVPILVLPSANLITRSFLTGFSSDGEFNRLAPLDDAPDAYVTTAQFKSKHIDTPPLKPVDGQLTLFQCHIPELADATHCFSECGNPLPESSGSFIAVTPCWQDGVLSFCSQSCLDSYTEKCMRWCLTCRDAMGVTAAV